MVKMLNVLFFVIGFLICWVITKKPLQIKVHHVNENVIKQVNIDEIRAAEEEMLTEDPKLDQKYANFDTDFNNILKEVNETMGGSDR